MAEFSVRPSTGEVARRRWRHEQQTVRTALAAATHHSAQQNAAPRGPKTGTRAREVEEQVPHVGLRAQKTPPPGERPSLRSPRRREVTAASGTSQGMACRSSPCRYWQAVRARPWTRQPSPSSSLSRWRRRSTRSRRRERRRRRRPSWLGRSAVGRSRTKSRP